MATGAKLKPFGPMFFPQDDPNSMMEMGSLAQMALRSPELVADQFAAKGLQPQPVDTSIGKDVLGSIAGTVPQLGPVSGEALSGADAAGSVAKALGALTAEPAQPLQAPPSPVAPMRGGTTNPQDVMALLQLLSSPMAAAGQGMPNLGSLINGGR